MAKPMNLCLLSERQTSETVSTASQKWCLFRLLAFYNGSLYSSWHIYLLYRDIAHIVMAAKVWKNELAFPELLVHTLTSEVTEVFGTVLTPKWDYLLHHPRLILMYEPRHSLWCMRFKRKHQYFNNLTHDCWEFKASQWHWTIIINSKGVWNFLLVNIFGGFWQGAWWKCQRAIFTYT